MLVKLIVLCFLIPAYDVFSASTSPKDPHPQVQKTRNKKVYVHLMPWFETKNTSENHQWGIHWTMANKSPDNIIDVGNKRFIASRYYPEIHPYGSGDLDLIDYQIQLMKYSGIDGVLMDWPGTTKAFDYPKNLNNADAFIKKLEAAGLKFAIVYEDHNLGLAVEGGFIRKNDTLAQGRKDMEWLRDHYFGRKNYIKVKDAPLLMTLGPQTLSKPDEWDFVFDTLPQKPTFLTLWYQSHQGGKHCKGEYPWIYTDFIDGVKNFYKNRPLEVKFGIVYPGLNTSYVEGGWPGPDWALPYNGLSTFTELLDLALETKDVEWIQIATWNDYGEGTMIEPTREFGTGFLNVLQNRLKVPYGNVELGMVKDLYLTRQQFKSNPEALKFLEQVNGALNSLQPKRVEKLLLSFSEKYQTLSSNQTKFSQMNDSNSSNVLTKWNGN